MDLTSLCQQVSFRTCAETSAALREVCTTHDDIATYMVVGKSELGSPIEGVILGRGEKVISLVAGSHSDEPVGPETLRTLILQGLQHRKHYKVLFDTYRLVIIPHINPDGEVRNRAWIEQWPDVAAYIRHAYRELPGSDIEFGYPSLRVENRHAAKLWQRFAPFHLHLSLHGMGFSEGAMLLIERHWIERTAALRERFVRFADQEGLNLHDHDRRGEKGFQYIGPGFTTTPEGRAMQTYFRERKDDLTASQFHLSSMEYIRSLGGDPLCLVTEFPLFLLDPPAKPQAGIPSQYLAFKEQLPGLKKVLEKGNSIDPAIAAFGLKPLDLTSAVRFQLRIIQWGLETIL